MALTQITLLLLSVTLAMGQRGSFAGTKPIGFPELLNKTTTTADGLGNRLSDDVTTQKLPLEALGNKDLVDSQSKLPEDNQLFWFLNAQALEANRQKPQVYPQSPNFFAQPLNPQFVNSNKSSSTSQSINTNLTGNTDSGNSVSRFDANSPTPQPTTVPTDRSTPGNLNSGITTQSVPQNSIGDGNVEIKQKANL